jgi:hypothetical protein
MQGKLPGPANTDDIELYDQLRYFTFSGVALPK